jgi:hypothetical protein
MRSLYRVLIECMNNTKHHAGQSNESERWCLIVYNDEKNENQPLLVHR